MRSEGRDLRPVRILQDIHSTAQRDRGAKLIGSLFFGQLLTLLLLPRDQLFQADLL